MADKCGVVSLREGSILTSFPEGWAKPRKQTDSDGAKPPAGRAGTPLYRNPLALTLLFIAVLVAIVFAASQLWTEVLWFDQLDAAKVLWTRWGASAVLFVVAFLFQYAAIMGCVYWTYSGRSGSARGQSGATMRQYQQAVEPFRKALFWGVPAVVAGITAIGVAANWQTVLLWLNRAPFGSTDPQFGLDISFFVFTLPVLEMLSGYLLGTAVVCLIAIAAVNYMYGGLTFTPRFRTSDHARVQIGLMAAALSLIVGLRYWLGIYSLPLAAGESTDGAMYTDVNATLPAQLILAVISVLVSILFVVAAFRGTWKLPAVGVGVTIVSALVIGGAYPALVQQFKVTPNEQDLEKPYIQRNIDATLAAYGLDEVEFQTYPARTDASAGQLREDSESTSQIRLLDPGIISPTVRQLQQSRPYYTFEKHLAVDRYTIEDERRDTVIAVRDINLDGLQPQQQTWVNQRTVYTHGFGVVAAFGNTVQSNGTPAFWEQSIPSVGEMGAYEPRVYFSPKSPEYSIVGAPEGSTPLELDYPDDSAPSGQVMTTFTGDGGPNVGNPWNKLLYAVKFMSTDILFSAQTNAESQILYDRNPSLRVAKVAPYLTLEQRAYPAVVDMDGDPNTPKRLVWIIDGYTTSDMYPYSQHQSLTEATTDSRAEGVGLLQSETVNYMRNSVKAVVDAYDGSVKLFAWDDQDPLLQAWDGVYPGMLSPMSEISGDLMSHLRYPEDMFKVQRKLLETYHVTEAAKFYTGGDRWRLSEDPTAGSTEAQAGTSQKLQPPYYLTMQMPGQDSAEFSLTSVYVPAGAGDARRAAMAGFLAVDSETGDEAGKVREDYGKLRLMSLPSSTTVPGPGQVQNNFNTDQGVAMELNLLDQQGSSVRHGNLLTLPVGGGLLYVQPVYVESTSSTSYPVLRYVLTAFGDQVGFGRTLSEALDQTFGGDAQATVTDPDGGVNQGDDGDDQATLSDEERLNKAIVEAKDAMVASQKAMAEGDWTAYGKAQEDLGKALDRLVALQQLVDETTETTVDPNAQINPGENLGELGEDAEQATDEQG